MAIRKIEGHWYVDFRFRRARLRKRSPLNTKAGAHQYELVLRQELAVHGNLERLDPLRQKDEHKAAPTFAEFAERWMREYVVVENKYSEQYTKRLVLQRHLLPEFGSMPLTDITAADVDRFKRTRLAEGLKAKSVNNYLAILAKCLKTAIDWNVITSAPRIRLLRFPAPTFRYLSEAELTCLVSVAEGVWHDMIVFVARTGLRFSEVTALDWSDVDLDRQQVAVRRGRVLARFESTKNYRIRHVHITNEVVSVLRSRQRNASGLVFLHQGRPICSATGNRRLHAICDRASMPRFGWHVFRHTFASALAQRGASLQALQRLLGHSSIAMVLRYAHLSPDYLADTVRLLEPSSRSWAAGGQPEVERRNPALVSLRSQSSESLPGETKKDHALA